MVLQGGALGIALDLPSMPMSNTPGKPVLELESLSWSRTLPAGMHDAVNRATSLLEFSLCSRTSTGKSSTSPSPGGRPTVIVSRQPDDSQTASLPRRSGAVVLPDSHCLYCCFLSRVFLRVDADREQTQVVPADFWSASRV